MSTTTETGARAATEAQLLYVVIDLGDQPDLEEYGRSVAALLTLARYATFRSRTVRGSRLRGEPEQEPLPATQLRIVRTSLASPWVSVLGDLARSSGTIAYSVTALYALHRLLQLVMTWQRHRLDIAERDLRLQQLRKQINQMYHIDPADVVQTVQPDPSTKKILEDVEPLPEGLAKRLAERETVAAAERVTAESAREPDPAPYLETVVQAAEELGEIQAAELVDPQDPRATGASPAERQ